MEIIKGDINNQIAYPDRKIMELFLLIGQKADMFNTVMMNIGSGSQEKRYLSSNDIRCLALVSEYMTTSTHEKEMEDFLNTLQDQTPGVIYALIARRVLKIRGEKKQNEYTKQTIKLYQDKLGDKEEINPSEMPIIPQSILPDRRKESRGVLMHEKFQERIANEDDISNQADEIEKQTKKHIFIKQDSSDEINNFKNKL